MISPAKVKRSCTATFVLNSFDLPGITIFSNTQWTQQVYLMRACKTFAEQALLQYRNLEKAATD